MRRQIADIELFQFYGSRLDGNDLERLLGKLHKCIRAVESRVLRASVEHLAGTLLTPELGGLLAWRLAGNVFRLRRGEVVLPWTQQRSREWVPVQVLNSIRTKNFKNESAVMYTLLVMAGTPCTMKISQTWKMSFCRMVSRRIGYTGHRGKFIYGDPSELVNLRFKVLLEPELTRNNQPGFKRISCTGQLLEWNKAIISKRFRIADGKVWPCPNGYKHRCYRCPVGYHDCEAATHPLTIQLPQVGVSHEEGRSG